MNTGTKRAYGFQWGPISCGQRVGGEFVSIEHDFLYGRGGVPPRPPPRPPAVLFVHCFDCRVPVTPSGRQPLITEPPTGDRDSVEALHEMTLRLRGQRPASAHDIADVVALIRQSLEDMAVQHLARRPS